MNGKLFSFRGAAMSFMFFMLTCTGQGAAPPNIQLELGDSSITARSGVDGQKTSPRFLDIEFNPNNTNRS